MESTGLLPPEYSTTNSNNSILTTTNTTTSLLITPINSNITFQTGTNFNSNWNLEGEVQIKFDDDDESNKIYKSLDISFYGKERRVGEEFITLFEVKKSLWSSLGPVEQGEEIVESPLNSINKFKLNLTSDLPQCIHLINSTLDYNLIATLTHSNPNISPIIKSTPVHLIRYSTPGLISLSNLSLPPGFSLSPKTLSITTPISVKVKFNRTVFKKSERIKLVATVEVPNSRIISEAGLRLRTISAELKRRIKFNSLDSTAVEVSSREGEKEGQLLSENVPISESEEDRVRVITRSGKSCRFSPTRPIVIKLVLHPPPSVACESISQSTILHTVSFSVIVTISIISEITRRETPLQITIPILILPDSPPPPPPSTLSPNLRRSEKQREVESNRYQEDWNAEEGPVPAYHESIPPSSPPPPNIGEGSTSSSSFFHSYARTGDDVFLDNSTGRVGYIDNYEGEEEEGNQEEEEEEEEYDGYEELSASLSNIIPPPRIDEDCSPPSVSDTNLTGLDNLSDSRDTEEGIEEDEAILPSFEDVVPQHHHQHPSYSNNNLVGQSRIEGVDVDDDDDDEEEEEEELHPPSFAEVVQISPNHQLLSNTSRLSLRSHPDDELQESNNHSLPTFSASTSNSTSISDNAPHIVRSTSAPPHSLIHSVIPISTMEIGTISRGSEISTNTNSITVLPPPPPYVNLNSPPIVTTSLVGGIGSIGGNGGRGVVISGPPPYLF